MRTNIYSQEITDEVKLIEKIGPDGQIFSAVQLMLHSSDMLHQPPNHNGDDDDRSAISLWLPKSPDRREIVAKTLERMAGLVRSAKVEESVSRRDLSDPRQVIFSKPMIAQLTREMLIDKIRDIKPSGMEIGPALHYGLWKSSDTVFSDSAGWIIERLKAQPTAFLQAYLTALDRGGADDTWFEQYVAML